MPLFTIATISWNQEKWVSQAIESVLASSYADFEYLIADDNSSDKTWDIIQSYNDPRIKAWRNSPNLGEYANRNDVLNKAKGDFILFVDGDDILYKNTLEEYARLIEAFPDTCGIWGVHPPFLDFIVFPYQLTPLELTRFHFLSRLPIAVIGLTESLFKTSSLKEIGGFDPKFGLADTYAKKKFSCRFPVVIVPTGKGYWRQSANQASQRVRKKMRNFVETFEMDREVIESSYFPLTGAELQQAKFNFRNRRAKLVCYNTIPRLDIYNFFRLMREMKIPVSDLFHLFRNGDYSYKADADASEPLANEYNFTKKDTARAVFK